MVIEQQKPVDTAGKLVVLVVNHDEERHALTDVLHSMQLQVKDAATGAEALSLLEDHPVDLLIMDIKPVDMHGWQLLAKVREIDGLRDLPVIVLSDQATMPLGVLPVVYLMRPVSIAKLRQNVRDTLSL